MNKSTIALLCTSLFLETSLFPCPTCMTKLEITTPPLFSKEYEKEYSLYNDKTLDTQGEEPNHEHKQ